jgi:hypothetical protein
MCWQAIAAGSNGIFLYSVWLALEPANLVNPPMDAATEWTHLTRVGNEIMEFAPVLFQPRMLPVPTVAHHPAWLMLRSHWTKSASATDGVADECFVFAVSDGTGAGTVTLGGFGKRSLTKVTVANEQPPRVLPLPQSATNISFAIEPMDVVVLQVSLKSDDESISWWTRRQQPGTTQAGLCSADWDWADHCEANGTGLTIARLMERVHSSATAHSCLARPMITTVFLSATAVRLGN